MKIRIIIFLSCISSFLFSQNKKDDFLNDNSFKMTIDEILACFNRDNLLFLSQDCFSGDGETLPKTKFENIFYLDVINYFKLKEYNTELKVSIFKKSSEYLELYEKLKLIKDSVLNSIYYSYEFNGSGIGGDAMSSVEYNVKKGGFEVSIGAVEPFRCCMEEFPKVIGNIEFKQLNLTKKFDWYSSKDSWRQMLFIQMSREDALEVEHNANIKILKIYSIKGIIESKATDPDFLKGHYNKPCKVKVIAGGNLRIIIFDNMSKKIYFDKLYKDNSKNSVTKSK